MKINLEQLEAIIHYIFNHLKELEINDVEIEKDFYWNLPKESLYDPYHEPKNFDLGQLSEDWNELLSIFNKEKEPLGYSLVWVASILRFLGEKIIK